MFKCIHSNILYFFKKKRVLNACGERGDGSCDHHGSSCGEFCDSEPFNCYNIHQEKKYPKYFNNSIVHILYELVDAFCGNVIADNVNGVFGHNDVFRFHLVNLCNGASVFIFALHQQLVFVLTDSNNNRFIQ